MKDVLKAVVYAGIFAVPFVVLLVTSSMFFPYITGKNFAFRIIVEVIIAAWLVLMLYDAKYRPKFSWIAISGLVLLGIMFIANLFGEYPNKSFWSNFERMEGYVTLVHFYLYFIVVGTMLTVQKYWDWFFNTTLSVAVLVCVYAFAQISGAADISQGGGWRVDSTFGNSTYMAVYMLFHVFIAGLMMVRVRSRKLKYLYGALIALFVFILFQTGTRGAALGLVGGGLLSTLYIVLFAHGYPALRKLALGGLIALAVLIGGFIAIRDTAFVQNTPMLDRLTAITLSEGSIRFMVWGAALEGVAERPILGWGQSNFNYVFNQYYDPELYRAEAWYDRVHNIMLDWLIAGGVLGALAYFSILASALYYTVVQPFVARMRKLPEDTAFNVTERALLLGLLAAYMFHNLFVFDNIVSYIFYAVILAFIHSRISSPIAALEQVSIDRQVVGTVVAPIVGVVMLLVVYYVNVPAMRAAGDIIDALKTQNVAVKFEALETALDRNSFGTQEAVEQLSEAATNLAAMQTASDEQKEPYLTVAETALLDLMEKKPGDARFHIFLAGLYRAEERYEDAAAEMAQARVLSPRKPDIVLEQGIIELVRGNVEGMHQYFREAYELAPDYDRSQILYASSLFYVDATEQLPEVLTEEVVIPFVEHTVVQYALMRNDGLPIIAEYFATYMVEHPESTTVPTAYALLMYQFGDAATATAILTAAGETISTFAPKASCYIDNIEAGEPMRADCI